MRRGLALLLTATLALSMTACGGSKGAGTQKSEKGDGMTYAVEAGSAGEAVAKEKGFNYNSVSSQADALRVLLLLHISPVYSQNHMLTAARRRLQRNTEYRIHFLSRSLASSSSLTATVMWIISSHRAR